MEVLSTNEFGQDSQKVSAGLFICSKIVTLCNGEMSVALTNRLKNEISISFTLEMILPDITNPTQKLANQQVPSNLADVLDMSPNENSRST